MLNLTNARQKATLVIDKNLTEPLHLTRISSVGRVLDCRAGGRGFDSRGRTNIKVLPLPCPDLDDHARKMAVPFPSEGSLKKNCLGI